MKNLKIFLFVLAIPLFIFCSAQKKDNRQNKNVTTASLIGKWNQVNKLKSSEISNPEVEYFQILNDSIVDIQLVDSNKRKKITGKWENGFNQKIGSTKIEINGDIKITYDLTDNHRYILALKLSDDNGKTILLANKYKFEKEGN